MAGAEIARAFNRVTMGWPGGEHSFGLNIGELLALQSICKAGPNVVLNRLQTGSWHVEDVRAVLRLGLIGAGMEDEEAKLLVFNNMAAAPLLKFVMPAHYVLAAALVGSVGEDEDTPPDDESGDGDAASGNVQAPKTS